MRIAKSVLALVLSCTAEPEAAADDRRQQLLERLPTWLRDSAAPSAAVALIDDGELQWTVVAGTRGNGKPADDNTLYNVASLTKPITAEVVLRASVAGLLPLDAPLTRYWADPDIVDDAQRQHYTCRTPATETLVAPSDGCSATPQYVM